MGKSSRVITVALLALSACSGAGAEPSRSPTVMASPAVPAPAPTPSPRPSPTPTLVTRIHVGALPNEGIAVDLGNDVVLLDVHGHALARLPGTSLYYQWTVPGSVILRSRHVFSILRVGAGVVESLPSREAAGAIDPQLQDHVKLPRPKGTMPGFGRWAYALPGPHGLTLAQWSGECEVPLAVFVSPGSAPGSAPRAVTGEPGLTGPESFALGWDDGGRAIVQLREGGGCDNSFSRPGIYAFTGPGVGVPVFVRSGIVAARMWGPQA